MFYSRKYLNDLETTVKFRKVKRIITEDFLNSKHCLLHNVKYCTIFEFWVLRKMIVFNRTKKFP